MRIFYSIEFFISLLLSTIIVRCPWKTVFTTVLKSIRMLFNNKRLADNWNAVVNK